MANIWFEANKREIEAIKRQLIEYNYAGSYGGSINLMKVNNIIDGLLIEVTKLDKENTDLKLALKHAKSKDRTEGESE
jgi:hypothetical protein